MFFRPILLAASLASASAFSLAPAPISPALARATDRPVPFLLHGGARLGGAVPHGAAIRAPKRVELRMMAAGTGAGSDAVEKCGRFEEGFAESSGDAVPIEGVLGEGFADWLAAQDEPTRAFVNAMEFKAKTGDPGGRFLVIPGSDMLVAKVVVIVGDSEGYGELFSFADLPAKLPAAAGPYRLADLAGVHPDKAALGWALGCYSFDRYKSKKDGGDEDDGAANAALRWPEGCDVGAVRRAAEATFLCRDLITTPAEDCAPGDLQDAAAALAARHGGAVSAIVGDDLLTENYPQARPPRPAPRPRALQPVCSRVVVCAPRG